MDSDHPNIVKLYAYIEDARTINMVMEYVSKGNLFNHLKESQSRKFSEDKVAIYFKDIISAFEYLHSKNPPILHR